MTELRRGNIHTGSYRYDDDDPPGYKAAVIDLGKDSGGGDPLSVRAFEIPAGESLCPYHYEYVEEWLIVVAGEIRVRVPDGEEQLVEGDVMRFPPGVDGAHKVCNRSGSTARIVMFSSAREPSIAVYPDSDKVGAWSGDEDFMFKRRDGKVPYYEGES